MSLKGKLAAKAKAVWNDESAQGATEYILILVAVVVIAFVLKDRLLKFVNTRLDNLDSGLNKFNANDGG